jgi:uncharacterized membrane protein
MFGNGGMHFARFGMGGMHIWSLVIGILFLALLILLVIWLVKSIFFSGRGSATAQALLDERLARGQISLAEYEKIKKALQRK